MEKGNPQTLPLAVQLYTLRSIMPGDVAGTLRELLDELGLEVCSSHVALDLLENDFDRTVETYRTLRCPILVVPSLPEPLRKDFAAAGARLTQVATRLRDAGMRLAYHNHNFELRDQGGTT